ncbi:Outer dense fiber protein 3 [Orchesella cincta]|uniref:Outer dense fiber protein 3 n=1 Tax=Orchesella cincta TaxID=48709 RepID=A0A1D2NJS7_ORCCI|nr:Outer dense fiber protein 3 [Orchesella cincta]
MKGKESDPSPIEWGNKPAEAKIKVLPRAPCPIIHGNHDTLKGKFKMPGPNKYFIEECPCIEPGVSFKGRYKEKIGVTPGPADYTPKYVYEQPPTAVIQGRHKEKAKKVFDPGFITMKPDKIVGGLMTPRWREREEEVEGPEMTNTFGMTNRGNARSAIPISFKSRHTPFKYSHMAEPRSMEYSGTTGKC